MQDKTKNDYRKLAQNFYEKQLKGEPPSPKRVVDALKNAATEYRPAYWRRLRNALAFDQAERGFAEAAERINATKNPATKSGSFDQVKPKQHRIKKVSQDDENKLLTHLKERGDHVSMAAILVTSATGARPAELSAMRVEGGRIYIQGAKKSHGGRRGADRVMELPERTTALVASCLRHLQGVDVGPVQDRIRAAGRRIWPQRKAVPSLYSWRHQMGSELKASGLDRVQVAYLMGHQSTDSVSVYGNARAARGGRVLPKPAVGADLSRIRETHSEPPTRHAAAPVKSAMAIGPTAALDAVSVMEKMRNSGDLRGSTKGLQTLGKTMDSSGKARREREDGGLQP